MTGVTTAMDALTCPNLPRPRRRSPQTPLSRTSRRIQELRRMPRLPRESCVCNSHWCLVKSSTTRTGRAGSSVEFVDGEPTVGNNSDKTTNRRPVRAIDCRTSSSLGADCQDIVLCVVGSDKPAGKSFTSSQVRTGHKRVLTVMVAETSCTFFDPLLRYRIDSKLSRSPTVTRQLRMHPRTTHDSRQRQQRENCDNVLQLAGNMRTQGLSAIVGSFHKHVHV